MNMNCRTDYDCNAGNSCRSIASGGTECKAIVGFNDNNNSTKYQSSYIPKSTTPVSSGTSCKADLDCSKKEFCWSVMGKEEKECQARLPSNQADEQTAKNTDQKDTNSINKNEKTVLVNLMLDHLDHHVNLNDKAATEQRIKELAVSMKLEDMLIENQCKQKIKDNQNISLVSCITEDKAAFMDVSLYDKKYNSVVKNCLEDFTGYNMIEVNQCVKKLVKKGDEGDDYQFYYTNKGSQGKEWNENVSSNLENRNDVVFAKDKNKPYTGIYTDFYQNGHKKSDVTYKHGNKNGLTTIWYENGQKKAEGSFKNGFQDGVSTAWYDNGQKKGEFHVLKGKLHGLGITWDENGQKQGESFYKNDILMKMPSGAKPESTHSLCDGISNVAESIMKARQDGLSISKAMKIIQEEVPDQQTIAAYEKLTIAAYEKQRLSSNEYKTKSIEDFRDKAYLDCVKAAK